MRRMKTRSGFFKRYVLRAVPALLAFLLCAAMLPPPPPAYADSQETAAKIQQAMEEQAMAQEAIDAIAAEAAQLAGTVDTYSGNLSWLNSKSREEQQQYEQLLAEQNAALQELEQAYQDYLDSEAELAEREIQYRDRLQAMFEFREKSALEVFLESDNLQGFFSNMELIRAIADYDQQMLTELEAARDDAELKHADAEAKRVAADAVVVAKQAAIDELRGQIERNTEELVAAQAVLAARQAEEDEMLAESERIGTLIHELQVQKEQEEAEEEAAREAARRAAEEARLAAEEAARANRSGTMTWPVPSSRWLTSPFQPDGRTDLPGQTRPHMGVDIGAPYGSPVVAAAGGTVMVVYSPWEGQNTGGYGYGNYVVVNHHNGVATLYAHLKSTAVVLDQYVSPGEVIGYIGSTGNSTGPHLHFEVRVDGYPVEPLQQQYIGQP